MQTQNPKTAYMGLWDCIRNISHESLSKGFFRGMSWPLVSFGVMNSIFFGTYGGLLQHFSQNVPDSEQPHFQSTFCAGFLATFPTVFIATPIDVVKVTLQAQVGSQPEVPKSGSDYRVLRSKFHRGPLEASVEIVKLSGVKGIFRGFWTQLARDSPANAVYMSSYEMVAYEANEFLPSVPNPFVNFFCGGLAGVLSWIVVMPLDVVKSRMQVDTGSHVYTGFWHCAKKAYREEGWRVFYRGALAVTLRAFPVNAVTLMVYTEVLLALNNTEDVLDA
ncbi:solute carrier family 25 member 45-like isoform X2 [Babylonia areolata]